VRRTARLTAEGAVALIGVACVVTAVLAPRSAGSTVTSFRRSSSRHDYVLRETVVRITLECWARCSVLFVRPRIGRVVARSPTSALGVLVATVLALGASELVLRHVHLVRPNGSGVTRSPGASKIRG
jgi:hypothetical protein